MKPRKFKTAEGLRNFLSAHPTGVFHAIVLHDNECTPTDCVCEPEYIVEEGTEENMVRGAQLQAQWYREKEQSRAQTIRETLDAGLSSQIVQCAAWWRGAEPGGVGVVLSFDDPGAGKTFATNQHKLLLHLDMIYSADRALSELTELRKRYSWTKEAYTAPRESVLQAFTLIHWLETRDHLVSDEHNGVVWIIINEGQIVTIRKDKPDPDLWVKAVGHFKIHHPNISVDRIALQPDELIQVRESMLGWVSS